jgi:hypothetical protein
VRDGQPAAAAERAAAAQVVQGLVAFDALLDRPTDARLLLRTTRFADAAALLHPAEAATLAAAITATGDAQTDLGDCTAYTRDTAAYADCEIAEHLVEGNVSRHPGHVTAVLTDVFVRSERLHGAIHVDARVNRSSDGSSGDVDYAALWETPEGEEWTSQLTLRADGLILDETGCVTAGSLSITGATGRSSAARPGQRDATRVLSFGPGCGDLLVSR